MTIVDVRRLAAVDMHGSRGSRRRCRVITAEFVLGAALMVGFGTWVLASAHGSTGAVVGAWLAGAGLNYVPLAVHALSLRTTEAVKAELGDSDIGAEARRYGVLQLWIMVPLALVAADLVQRRRG